MRVRPIALALLFVLPAAPVAQAVQQAKSRYSTIEFAKCQAAGAKAWRCPGLPGYPLYVALGKVQTFLSIGPMAERRRAARQSLASANSLFDGRSQRSAIEWRFVIRDKKTVPYATIVRYFTQDRNARGEVVVVTRITENESCQVARIDALANADAMVMARTVADRQARTFDCRQEPLIVGRTGKSPM
jgi:hypothetical protein